MFRPRAASAAQIFTMVAVKFPREAERGGSGTAGGQAGAAAAGAGTGAEKG
jgi:hypothetical protein